MVLLLLRLRHAAPIRTKHRRLKLTRNPSGNELPAGCSAENRTRTAATSALPPAAAAVVDDDAGVADDGRAGAVRQAKARMTRW